MLKTLTEMFQQTAAQYPDKPAFLTRSEVKENGQKVIKYDGPTWSQLFDDARDLATGLIELGVAAKDHVALLADNRYEWILCDYAILMTGAADVPRGTDITESEIEYIVNHSDATVVFVEHEKMLDKLLKVKSNLTKVTEIIVMDPGFKGSGDAKALADVQNTGAEKRKSGDDTVAERMKAIQPDDLFTIIYTSGTTGPPKGVMLSHANMMFHVQTIPKILDLSPADRALSILPVWHVFERVFEYLFISRGCSTYYTGIKTLKDDIKVAKPTIMGSAPRLWESIYQRISDTLESAPQPRKTLALAAVKTAAAYGNAVRFLSGNDTRMEKLNFVTGFVKALFNLGKVMLLFIPNKLLDAIVLKKLRGATGGELRATVSGGGALPLHIDEFYNSIGIPVLEGYGMTETAPVIACRTEDSAVLGTVGPVVPGCEVEIRDDAGNDTGIGKPGVIHIKGPQVMQGYYKNEEATKKVLNDGWMNTGDIGIRTFNDPPCIKITGRAKDTIVLFSGENVEPVPIENQISDSAYIAQNMVVGQDQKTLGALIYLDEEKITAWAADNGLSGKSFSELQSEEAVKKLITGEIKNLVNGKTGFKGFERVTDFRIIPKEFEVGDEMTNLFKLKRHVITGKYQNLIDEMYG